MTINILREHSRNIFCKIICVKKDRMLNSFTRRDSQLMNKKFETIYLILCSCCNANVSKNSNWKNMTSLSTVNQIYLNEIFYLNFFNFPLLTFLVYDFKFLK